MVTAPTDGSRVGAGRRRGGTRDCGGPHSAGPGGRRARRTTLGAPGRRPRPAETEDPVSSPDQPAPGHDASTGTPRVAAAEPATDTRRPAYGLGRLVILGYAIVAGLIFYREVARLAELGGQAPLSAVLSVVATLLYVVTAVAVAHNGRRMRRVAWVCTVAGLIGVLGAGLVGLADPDLVVARTVWSEFGAGYAFAPLVLPLVAAFWLWWSRPGRTG